jgi:type II restriction/modification system DNA methylase subunit YeeA
MRANYGGALRKYLAENTQARILIDFGGFKVFDSATVDTNILLTQNSVPGKPDGRACSIKADFHKGNSITKYVAEHGIPLPTFDQESWIIADDAAQKLKAKIERIGTPLKDWDISIYRGILTGYNEAFIISGAKKDELIAADPRSAEIIKPILRGRDIKRYKAEFADLWLIATHNGFTDSQGNKIPRIEIIDYPAIKRHLDGYWDKIEKRADQGATPYNLRNCAYMAEFEIEKVVYPETTSSNSFYYDREGFMLEKTGFMLRSVYAKYLLGVLNSSFFLYVYKSLYSSVELGSKGYQFNKHALEKYPVPHIIDSERMMFEKIVDLIIDKRGNLYGTQDLESQIDLMVYKLYELSYSEAKLIDPDLDSIMASFGLSAQDFERMSIEDLSKLEVK